MIIFFILVCLSRCWCFKPTIIICLSYSVQPNVSYGPTFYLRRLFASFGVIYSCLMDAWARFSPKWRSKQSLRPFAASIGWRLSAPTAVSPQSWRRLTACRPASTRSGWARSGWGSAPTSRTSTRSAWRSSITWCRKPAQVRQGCGAVTLLAESTSVVVVVTSVSAGNDLLSVSNVPSVANCEVNQHILLRLLIFYDVTYSHEICNNYLW